MAERVAGTLADRDIRYLVSSPLEQAQETAAPSAKALGLDIVTDERVIEAGTTSRAWCSARAAARRCATCRPGGGSTIRSAHRGEAYRDIVVRMLAALHDAREAASGHEALIVSHQLPIWTARSYLEGRRLAHDPRRRQCSLASLTSITYQGEKVVSLAYSSRLPTSSRYRRRRSSRPGHELAPEAAGRRTVRSARRGAARYGVRRLRRERHRQQGLHLR